MASAFFIRNQTHPVPSVNELGVFIQLPNDAPASVALATYSAAHPVELGDVVRVVDASGVSTVKTVSAGLTFQAVAPVLPVSGT